VLPKAYYFDLLGILPIHKFRSLTCSDI